MKPQTYGCGLEAALDVVGGKWKPIVLWQLASGPRRFGELRRTVSGISEKMLIQQLRDLEGDGIVTRTVYPQVPPKVEYSLTARGRGLLPIIDAIVDWGMSGVHEDILGVA